MLVDNYRPTVLKDVLLDAQNKKQITKISKGKELPHLLLYGSAGCGKTTVARILVDKHDSIFLNASTLGVKDVKKQIMNFATTVSLTTDGGKVIIMDEADNMSKAMQQALRSTIEQVQSNCKFIFTANYVDRIIPAIQSRCSAFDFSINVADEKLKKQTIKRLQDICKDEGIAYNPSDIKLLVDDRFPDIRSCIQNLDSGSKSSPRVFDLPRNISGARLGENVSITIQTGKILQKRPESQNWYAKIWLSGERRYVRRSLGTTDKAIALHRLEEEYERVTGKMDRERILVLINTMQNELTSLKQYLKNTP